MLKERRTALNERISETEERIKQTYRLVDQGDSADWLTTDYVLQP